MMFHPFRFGLWARLAVVALITGEAGGGGSGGSAANFGSQRGGHRWAAAAQFVNEAAWEQIQPYLFWIVLGFVVLAGLLFLWVYSDCVYRFILLDSVLTGQCRLREGWRQWRYAGRRYLLWVIAFGFSALGLLGIVAGVPALLAYQAGWFEKSDEHLWGLIGGGVLLVFLLLVVVAALLIIDLFARDFLIPVMAFDNVGAAEGWRRLLAMMGAEKGAYALYVLMKIVLNAGSAIIFTIINLIVILILLIPMVALGAAGYLIGRNAGLAWDNPSTILLLVALGMLALAGILYAIGFVYAPGLVFFQAYTLMFFGTRYEALGSRMFPTPPPVTPAPLVPAVETLPPPEPSPV